MIQLFLWNVWNTKGNCRKDMPPSIQGSSSPRCQFRAFLPYASAGKHPLHWFIHSLIHSPQKCLLSAFSVLHARPWGCDSAWSQRFKVCVGEGKKETQLIGRIISQRNATVKRSAIFIGSQGKPRCGCDIWAASWRRRRRTSHTWGEKEHCRGRRKSEQRPQSSTKAWCLREGILVLARDHCGQLLCLTFKIILECKWPHDFALGMRFRLLPL